MVRTQGFTSAGKKTDVIDVRLSYRIVELFSEGLYASPNKAIEELVANSFDAGAKSVQVLLSSNLHDQDATIAVIDDGAGMDADGLKQHWLIGISNKRLLEALPKKRQQIGKFGIGKLATYVLANRLTHFSRQGDRYFSTSMDYNAIDRRVEKDLEPKTPIKLDLRVLTESEAAAALEPWTSTRMFKAAQVPLFGKRASKSWTVTIMSSLKPKVHELKPGHLEWVLRTALPLRPDFAIWFNGSKLVPSKQGRGLLRKWILGKDLIEIPRPAPKDISASEDSNQLVSSDDRFGLDVPDLGRITGYAEIYKDLLTTGKSEDIGRSYGFFVYVYGRLLNVLDGHFGISPNELRHGTFGRFRLVVHMDGLDKALRSNREAVSEGPLLSVAQDVLRGIFNAVRPVLEAHESGEQPGAKLARRLASSPASLTRGPIVDLARAVLDRKAESRYLAVPPVSTPASRVQVIQELERRASEAETFISGRSINYEATASDGIAKYDIATGHLSINAWHPFVAAFHDEFIQKNAGQPLELFAMAEVLAEAHLHAIGVKQQQIDDFLSVRDELLRTLANESGQTTPFSIALQIREARNNPDALEKAVCVGVESLGLEVTPIGGAGKPDGVAHAQLAADDKGQPQRFSVSIETKSKESDSGTVAAGTVKVSTVARHRDNYSCQHALVVGRAFPTTKGDKSALAQEMTVDRERTKGQGEERTITLITIDDLARLVRMRPVKQMGLRTFREFLTTCSLSQESKEWIDQLEAKRIAKPPYAKIIQTIEVLQKKSHKRAVKYAALSNELSHLQPAIEYERDEELMELCKAMAQMAPNMLYARAEVVELDQSSANVIAAIDSATREYDNRSSK